MQQIFELLLTKQESPATINYSLIYRHSKGLFAFANEVGLDKQILLSDQQQIKCMAVSNYGVVFGGDFGIIHISENNVYQFDLKANSIAFSQDYEYIIVTAKETHLISTRTNKLIKSFPGPILFDSTNSLCFYRGTVYETATFSEIKYIKIPEGTDFSISVQRESLYVSNVTLIKHLQPLKDCMLIIDNYNTGQHFEHTLPPANEVKQLWSQDGKILLLWSQVLDDHTNQSYFGTHNLHLWTENQLLKVEVFEGPIHDVKWVEQGFIVISGYMPAGAILFNQKGQKQYLILQAHINAIYPKNDFIALAGFGNLSGEIFIYNLKDMRKIGQLRQDKVVSFEWSPSGKYFLLATTFPRLRVDNQFIICTRNGQFIHRQKFDEFYEIKWINDDDNLLIENNITDASTESKQVTLSTGVGMIMYYVDFIKQMKEAQITDQPRKLSNEEKLQNLRPVQQAVQLVPTNTTQNVKQPQSKPAPALIRRQEPMVQQVQQVQEPVQVAKPKKKKLNLYAQPIIMPENVQDPSTQFFDEQM